MVWWKPTVGVVALLLLVPGVAAATTASSDPVGDPVTYAAIFVGTQACTSPATDITHTSVTTDGTTLTITQRVVDLDERVRCGGIGWPATISVNRVFLYRDGGQSIVAWRTVRGAPDSGNVAHCYSLNGGNAVCGADSRDGDTIRWHIPIPLWMRGLYFDEIFGQGLAATNDLPFAGQAIVIHDFNDLPNGLRL